jgi:hypothetical protein
MPPPARSGEEEEEDTRVSRSREPWGSAFGLARDGETHESRTQQLAPAPGRGVFLAGCRWIRRQIVWLVMFSLRGLDGL